jgi:hypothetical protein
LVAVATITTLRGALVSRPLIHCPDTILAFDAQHSGPSSVDGRTLVQFASASLLPVLSKQRFRKLVKHRDFTHRPNVTI